MKRYLLVLAGILLLLPCSCSDNRKLWREQKLPSGKSVKVTSFLLIWGAEHDERISFAAVERARHYDFFIFRRAADGKWSCKWERR